MSFWVIKYLVLFRIFCVFSFKCLLSLEIIFWFLYSLLCTFFLIIVNLLLLHPWTRRSVWSNHINLIFFSVWFICSIIVIIELPITPIILVYRFSGTRPNRFWFYWQIPMRWQRGYYVIFYGWGDSFLQARHLLFLFFARQTLLLINLQRLIYVQFFSSVFELPLAVKAASFLDSLQVPFTRAYNVKEHCSLFIFIFILLLLFVAFWWGQA